MGMLAICNALSFHVTNDSRWHADIKPDNILEIEGKFKLADPGFARFLEKDKGKSNSDPRANMSGGTYSFGTYLPSPNPSCHASNQ